MIDFIKILQWLPTPSRASARKLHSDFLDVYGAMINQVKDRIDAGEEVPDCLVKTLLQCQHEEELSWKDMCFIVIAFTTGGVHSVSIFTFFQLTYSKWLQTSGIIEWFLALMPSHPHIQAKACEELDRVVGRHAWPTASDEMKLPYCRAIIKEVSIRLISAPAIQSNELSWYLFRFFASTLPSGWERLTVPTKISCTTGTIFLRIPPWF